MEVMEQRRPSPVLLWYTVAVAVVVVIHQKVETVVLEEPEVVVLVVVTAILTRQWLVQPIPAGAAVVTVTVLERQEVRALSSFQLL